MGYIALPKVKNSMGLADSVINFLHSRGRASSDRISYSFSKVCFNCSIVNARKKSKAIYSTFFIERFLTNFGSRKPEHFLLDLCNKFCCELFVSSVFFLYKVAMWNHYL